MTRILGVSGSMRDQSRSRRVTGMVLEQARALGAETRLIDLRATPLPLYRPDDDDDPPHYAEMRDSFLWADAVILASPDYHGGMSGAIKNFLDFFWREFAGKLFGYIVASHEKGLTVQDQLRTAVRQCYGWSLPYGIGFNGDADLEDGRPKKALADRITHMAHDLTVYGGMIHGQFLTDLKVDPRPLGFSRRYDPAD